MTRRPLTSLLSSLLTMALVATACGGGSGGDVTSTASDAVSAASGSETSDSDSSDSETSDSETSESDSSESDSSDSAASDSAASNSASGEDTTSDGQPAMAASSPIGAFFADGGGFEAALAEYTVRVEEEIVRCMAAQGFEYKVSGNGTQNSVFQAQNDLTLREWTEQYGFGISTSFDAIVQDQASDPNSEIFLTMSASERELWIDTLTGGGFEAATGDFNSQPLEEQGCIGQALIETGGQEAIEGLDEFGDVYDEGEQALFDRREMIEVIDAWSRCMGAAGYAGYTELDDPEKEIDTRLVEVTAPLNAALDSLSDEEGQALVSGESIDLADLPDLDLDALRSLQADEIDVAVADLDCYEAEVKDVYEPLRDEFEAGLLTEYSSELEALKNIGS